MGLHLLVCIQIKWHCVTQVRLLNKCVVKLLSVSPVMEVVCSYNPSESQKHTDDALRH